MFVLRVHFNSESICSLYKGGAAVALRRWEFVTLSHFGFEDVEESKTAVTRFMDYQVSWFVSKVFHNENGALLGPQGFDLDRGKNHSLHLFLLMTKSQL
ncbi:hypothetical protein TNCT_366011 [Trichonephila clavata]|uniref:Uncharacterized protein n=1 Tax=Trichonephila clavata TaxID=2740835 RepID=A0A8X6HFU3_TRICU|nr:hypothetical protein TNCT_366011 [Trichonephila clavata]